MYAIIITIYIILNLTNESIQQSRLYTHNVNNVYTNDFANSNRIVTLYNLTLSICEARCNNNMNCLSFSFNSTTNSIDTMSSICDLMKSIVTTQIIPLDKTTIFTKNLPKIQSLVPVLNINKSSNGYNITWSIDTQNLIFTRFTRFILNYTSNNWTNVIVKMSDFKTVDFDCYNNDNIIYYGMGQVDRCKMMCLIEPTCKFGVIRFGNCYIKHENYLSVPCGAISMQDPNYQSFVISDDIPISKSFSLNDISSSVQYKFKIQIYDSVQKLWTQFSQD